MKRVGLSAFDDNKIRQFQELGQSLVSKKQNELSTQLQVFKSILLNFLKEHNEELSKDLKLRNEFIKICSMVGIDPLMIYEKSNDLTQKNGMNEFYYELCVRLIEYSNSTKDINGGLLPIDSFLIQYSTLNITLEDLERCVGLLKVLNEELSIIKIGSIKYIKNFTIELTKEQNQIMEIVNNIGWVSYSILRDNLHWELYKAKQVLDKMVMNGYLWVDSQGEQGFLYWDPSWINRLE